MKRKLKQSLSFFFLLRSFQIFNYLLNDCTDRFEIDKKKTN